MQSCSESVGSDSRLVSHHSIWPSVETETHWLPVFELIQNTSYTGSWCDFSMMLVLSGMVSFEVPPPDRLRS